MFPTVIKEEKYTLVKINESRLTSMNAPELKSQFVMLNAEGIKNIIVDLSTVEYCDSSGLSAILVGNRLCRGANGSFVITHLQDGVIKIISISQLDRVLSITPSVEEAVDLVFMEEVERDLLNE